MQPFKWPSPVNVRFPFHFIIYSYAVPKALVVVYTITQDPDDRLKAMVH